MKSLIHKYSLTEKRYEDNRTIEEALAEVYGNADEDDVFDFAMTILRGEVWYSRSYPNSLYALSKSAIEQYLKEKK